MLKKSVLKVALWSALTVVLIGGGFYAWNKIYLTKLVTGESQQQAETTAGVELAAKNARIKMLDAQLREAAQQIAALKNREPDKIVNTVATEVVKVVEVERKKSGADFAIVTDPVKPNEQFDFEKFKTMSPNTTVSLNQYNVFAYKKVVRGINVYPDLSSKGIYGLSLDVSKRITKDGKYLGVSVGYNFRHNEGMIGLRYQF